MHSIYGMLRLVGDAINASFTWFFQFVVNTGMTMAVFFGLMATLLAFDLLVTFVRNRAIGSIFSDSSDTYKGGKG